MARLDDIEIITRPEVDRLHKAGISTTEGFLTMAGTPQGRQELSQKSRIEASRLLEFVNRADLMRLKGVGKEYSDLLEEAGVDTVRELAQRAPANLYSKVIEVNDAKHLTRRAPSESQIEHWIAEAKSLRPMVMH